MTHRLRWSLISAILFLSLYWGTWWLLSEHLRTRLYDHIHLLEAEGYQLAYKDMKIGGFPFSLKITLAEPTLTKGNTWRMWIEGDVSLQAALWNHRRVALDFEGSHHITVPEGWSFIGTKGRGECLLQDTHFLSLQYGNARLEGLGHNPLFEAQGVRWEGECILQHEGKPPKVLNSHVTIDTLTSPLLKKNPVSDHLKSIDLSIVLSGTIAGALPLEEALRAWYESGGVMDVEKLALTWGALTLKGEGTVSIDRGLQPMAAFAMSLEGLDDLLQALVAADLIKQKSVKAIKFAVAFLSQQQESNPKVAITLQDRQVSIGPMAVFAVPRIHWPVPSSASPQASFGERNKSQVLKEKAPSPRLGAEGRG